MGKLLLLRNWSLFLLQGLASIVASYGCSNDECDDLYIHASSAELSELAVERDSVLMYVNDTEYVRIISGNGSYKVKIMTQR